MKRGLSPVIATVLLVSLGLILAIAIFFWARSFIGDSIVKGERDIKQSCEKVFFQADAYNGELHVENLGSVPIRGFELSKKQIIGEITKIAELEEGTISAGQTATIELPQGVSSGDTVIVVPILLGETETTKKAYICDKENGNEILVE
ncbi:hypothetical protein HY450_01245 [Candidatus Pacearchaeota archaeon]|nr:hypothetical protein [Candidatus Pacearchaeota archaeon]